MWKIKINNIRINALPESISAFHFDRPKIGDSRADFKLEITGWVIGKEKPIQAIHLQSDKGSHLFRVDYPRPDVVEAHKNSYKGAATVGFRGTMPLEHASGSVVYTILAQLGSNRVRVGHIELQVLFDRPSIRPAFVPIFLTSLGRTGTTFCWQALGHHPEIAAPRFYPAETRMAHHYMACLRQSFQTDEVQHLPPQLVQAVNIEIGSQSIRHYVNCIDQFYAAVAQINGHSEARFFVEKFLPFQAQDWFRDIYPVTKEVFLVRDFRDMVCSILAFNKKLGRQAFGREHYQSDLDYVRHHKGPYSLLNAWKQRKNQAYLVRYEDLILNDQETLQGVFTYLGVDADPQKVQTICDFLNSPVGPFKAHMTSETRQESIQRWQRDLSPTLIKAANENYGPLLTAFGYDL
ncbi:MAG: sulfotransferase [Chloroflexota bacterium]